jgi:hypothetical protein
MSELDNVARTLGMPPRDSLLHAEPTVEMKGITLWEPFAHLVTIGAKMYDTRKWQTDYRGLVIIRSNPDFPSVLQELYDAEDENDGEHTYHRQALDQAGIDFAHLWKFRGYAIGLAYLAECSTVHHALREMHEVERVFNDIGQSLNGRHVLRFEFARRFAEPIPMVGRFAAISRLWTAPAWLVREVQQQIKSKAVTV